MMHLDLFLRILTICLLINWQIYWVIYKRRSDKEKKRTKPLTLRGRVEHTITFLLKIMSLLQLLGLSLFPLTASVSVQLTGLTLVIAGMILSIAARGRLGGNWMPGQEYQIKKHHELVTSGIYRYVRHPIYFGLLLTFIGVQLVALSSLFILFLILIPLIAYYSAKREEKVLAEYFGNKYSLYMKRSKMFIPFIF